MHEVRCEDNTCDNDEIAEATGKLELDMNFAMPISNSEELDIQVELLKDNQSEVLEFTLDPVVSSDVITSSKGALVDGLSTKVLSANQKQVKVVAWYDNEYGYTAQMLRVMDKLLKL